MFYNLTTKNIERKFKTELVASFVEVCYLGGFRYDEIFEFASFITGEEITMSNIANYRSFIMSILNEQYPELKRNIHLANEDILDEQSVKNLKNWYKNTYGNYILVKSIKKETVKELKLQNIRK